MRAACKRQEILVLIDNFGNNQIAAYAFSQIIL